jgi:hypothetical protein
MKSFIVTTLLWNFLWAGAWEEGKILNNRAEIGFSFPKINLNLRGEFLDRRPLDFSLEPPWDDPQKGITNIAGGAYHTPDGSRFLYGILDEWGLSARVRNPWIRSAPYAENRKPLMADLKTVASSTKKPEAYLYLASPVINLFRELGFRAFVSAQTHTEGEFMPDLGGGFETRFGEKSALSLEAFYTGAILPAKASASWFADPPPLPEREFRLYAFDLFFKAPFVSFSSDWAFSETFAWGRDLYGNTGLKISPPWPGPLSLSLAADGAGRRYTGRDGTIPGAGFRSAGKIEWKGRRSSLFRLSTVLRGAEFGESLNRSSTGVYYRFPAPLPARRAATGVPDNSAAGADRPLVNFPLRVSRVSLTVERNAADNANILDGIDCGFGLSLRLPGRYAPLGFSFSAAARGKTSADETPPPYPLPQGAYNFDSVKASGELSWSPVLNGGREASLWLPRSLQFKTKFGYGLTAKKKGAWDASFTVTARFKYGRLSLKVATPEFAVSGEDSTSQSAAPEQWKCSISWRVEK